MNLNIKEGICYKYKRPSWETFILCKAVLDRHGDIALKFHKKYYPTKVRNLPIDAIIEKIK